MKRFLAITACAVSLTACASGSSDMKPPAPQPIATGSVDVIPMPVNDRSNITYLARHLMPGSYQNAAAVFSGSSDQGQQGGGGYVVGMGVTGAIGQAPLSSGGSATVSYATEAKGAVDDLLGGKSASVQSSRVYLPASVNGKALGSAGEAREFVRQEVRKRVEEYARVTGRSVSCFDQCDSFYPTYQLNKVGGGSWRSYDPPALYVTFYLRKPLDKRKSEDAVLDGILNFSVAWEDVCYIALTDAAPAGGHKVVEGESVPDFPDRSTFSSPLERTLLRVMTKGGMFEFGAQNWQEVAWNGRVFALGEAKPASLVKYEIAPVTDAN